MNYVHARATEYVKAGISVIPLRLDGSKAPASDRLPQICNIKSRKQSGSWEPFMHRPAMECELIQWFASPDCGMGMICGAVSGGIEVIDFDDGTLFPPWRDMVTDIVNRLPVVETPSAGWHVIYRCSEIGGNVKIAVDPNREKQTLIETRGQGGYVVAEASPCSTHATSLPYVQYSGPKLPTIPTISPDDRRELWRAARSFDKRGEEFTRKLREKHQRRAALGVSQNVHPVIAAFCNRYSWDAILTPHGWTSRDMTNWTRPGKQHGVSARVVISDSGEELLTVFSANSGPLSPTSGYRTWNKFAAWTALEHRGDNRTAFSVAREEVSL